METNNGVTTMEETQNPLTLIAMAIEKGAGIDAIKELQLMQERWEDRRAKQAFSKDFVEMKGKLPRVARTKLNGQTKSRYAPLEDINSDVDPILRAHGFGTSTKILKQTADIITVAAELWHTGGHVEQTTIDVPVDDKGMQGNANKTRIQGIASSITYARRYAICALLNISTGDDSDGNQERRKVDPAQSKRLLEEAKTVVTKIKTSTEIEQSINSIINSYVDKGLGIDEERELRIFMDERRVVLKDYNELVSLFNEKRELLTPEEIEGVERVIKFGEVKSFKKVIAVLNKKQ